MQGFFLQLYFTLARLFFMSLISSYTPHLLEAGLDEAGRGCLAGPVVAAFVILPKDYHHKLLNDSKQVSKKNRLLLRSEIEKEALAFAIAEVCNNVIDNINILNASILAMHKALDKARLQPDLLLIDGNRFKQYKSIPQHCIIGGDAKYLSIAAASILAKTYRDEIMEDLGHTYPQYCWNMNAAYPTKVHRAAILAHGVTPYHRISFALTKKK